MKKAARKVLVKLTPGFNFINILRTTFTLVDPESVKNTVSHKYLFTPLGSTSAKAVRKTLVKLTPGRGRFANLRKKFCEFPP